ncbi:MAG TPA: HipA family kinase [Acidobacteriaceae bacterium]|nr:HipA family kinase [Acidobacteriaceae bacterium]
MAVLAVQHIRKMRGGAQGQLMLGADGHAYVVKFQNNPQHLRVLANELMATKLAIAVGLSAPACDVLEVTDWLIDNTQDLEVDFGSRRERCRAGHCFGSRLVGGLMPGHLLDYLPEEQLAEARNLEEFAGVLALDKWTCNTNGRQAVFTRKQREKRYTATFIDFGYCFNAGGWVFRDSPLRGVYARNAVYAGVTGWDSFEPWLSRIEALEPEAVWSIAETVPPEWYEGDAGAMETMVEHLLRRRSRVRELIDAFRESSREPFPNWGRSKEEVRAGRFVETKWDDDLRIGRLM